MCLNFDDPEHGRVVKIVNTTSALTLTTHSSMLIIVSGKGYWEETLGLMFAGLHDSTMPHELVNTAINTFTFKQIPTPIGL